MLTIVQGEPAVKFVASAMGCEFAEPMTAIGYAVDGKVAGAAIFNNFDGRNVNLTIAHGAQSWPPSFVRYFGDYIWNDLKVQRVTLVTRAELVPLCNRMGAKMEGVLRSWFSDGSDAVMLGILKAEWKLGAKK